MNQTPNIEETHNTKEVEEMLPTEMDLEKVGQHYWGGDYEPTYHELINLKQSFKEILTPKIERYLNQQLQKAREEEREKIFGDIEQFKAEVVTMDYNDDFKDGIYATIDHILSMPIFESVLNHSELDQDKV